MKINATIIAVFIFSFLLTVEIRAQQVKLKPFAVNQSNLINDLKKLKLSDPKMSADDLVKSANALLDKQGLNFVVGLDANTCQKIEQVKKAQKDQTAPLNLRTTLKSPLGEAAALLLPEASFAVNECLPCFVTLPFLEVTDKDFVTIVQDKNLKFFLPANFSIGEAFLVDEKDFATVKRKWKLPFKTAPLSVSDDGNILFVGFEESELNDFALAIFSEGSYQFYARKELDKEKKAIALSASEVKTTAPNFAFIKFQSADTKQIIKFPIKCAN